MSDENYYKIGGSLEYQHPTYVVRQADSELYEGLTNGEFCYVLNSRQMGKSSLRVQMMKKLKEQGFKCASIDMTRIGSHVTPAEWYAGIVSELLRGFGLTRKVNFSSWWRERELLPPLQRLREVIEDVLLVEFGQNIIIFLDEIDSILKIKFKDDFFAFIRACYNQRVDAPEYKRLTFCLLGVATPSDLIADKQRTPFNIGRAIELTGFKLEEAKSSLTEGLIHKVDNPEKVVEEVLSWTDGQPFLTQKLCQLVVEKADSRQPNIEQLVQQYVIENWETQDEPEHLRTIRDRLLRNEQHASRLLGLYQQILQLGEIAANDTPEQIELRLSGLVVKQHGNLRVYNRIYQSVFDLNWVEKELANLRPYSQAIAAWLASNRQDESRLLRGQALQEALQWATDKNLSTQDYQFLTASQKWELQEIKTALELAQIALIAEKNANFLFKGAQQKIQMMLPVSFGALISSLKIRLEFVFFSILVLLVEVAKAAIVSVILPGLIYGIFTVAGVPHQLVKTIAIYLGVLSFTVLMLKAFWENINNARGTMRHEIRSSARNRYPVEGTLKKPNFSLVRLTRYFRKPEFLSDDTGTQLKSIKGSQRQVTNLMETEYFQDLQKRAKELRVQSSLPLHRWDGSTNEELTKIKEEIDYLSQLQHKAKKLQSRSKEKRQESKLEGF